MLLIKQQSCQNNPNESYIERKAMHEPCDYSLDLVSLFDSKENKHNFYRGRDCIKKFWRNLKKLATKIINYEDKEIIRFMKSKRNATYVKKSSVMIKMKKRNINYTVRDHCHYTGKFRGTAHNICNLRYKVIQVIPDGS